MILSVKYLLIPFALAILFYQYFSNRTVQGEICQTVRVKYDFPLPHSSGVIIDEMNDSFDIYYFGRFTVYKFPTVEEHRIGAGPTTKKISPEYFVFAKGSTSGFFVDWKGSQILYPVDSFLRKRSFFELDVYSNLSGYFQKSKQKTSGDTTISYYYLPTDLTNDEIPDTLKLYSSTRWKNIPFTLSRKLDAVSKRKTYRVSLIYNSRKYKGLPHKFPSREIYIEFEPICNANCEEMKTFIKKLKQLIHG